LALTAFTSPQVRERGLVGDSLEFEGVRRANLGLWEI